MQSLRVLGLLALCAACDDESGLRVDFFDDEVHSFSWLESRTIRRIATDTAEEVRGHLPGLAPSLYLRVHAAKPSEVIESTGEGGSTSPPDTVIWTVDASRPGGVSAVAEAELRAGLFHELHHLVRYTRAPGRSLLDFAVGEGMATAFERDYAGAAAPWGWYPADAEVEAWVDELRALPDGADRAAWLGKHPDGRRWIGRKAGTYLVDRAVRASGRTLPQLVATPTDEILRLARR